MALAIPREKSSDCANPVLVHLNQVNGYFRDLFKLEFVIFDISTSTKRQTPVQVFPASGRHLVNLTACPTGDKLGLGRYVANYTVDAAEPQGDHRIVWYAVPNDGDPEKQFEQEFSVVHKSEVVSSSALCTISDLRDEGLTDCEGGDRRVLRSLERATARIHRITGRTFIPYHTQIKLNGQNAPILFLNDPIIAIEELAVHSFPFDPEPDFIFSQESVRVYNRHLTQNLRNPDDRQNPKIEIFRGPRHIRMANGFHESHFVDFLHLVFPHGQQNVEITGTFGYTDPDGSSVGAVPEDIKYACGLLAMRFLPQLSDEDRALDNQAWRIVMEKTRQQTIRYANPVGRAASMAYGYFTGDPEIDEILAAYMRPPELGTA